MLRISPSRSNPGIRNSPYAMRLSRQGKPLTGQRSRLTSISYWILPSSHSNAANGIPLGECSTTLLGPFPLTHERNETLCLIVTKLTEESSVPPSSLLDPISKRHLMEKPLDTLTKAITMSIVTEPMVFKHSETCSKDCDMAPPGI